MKSHAYYYSEQQQGIDRRMKDRVMARCLPYVQGPAVLDLGYVDGMWSDALLAHMYQVDIVEGASRHVEHALQHHRGIKDVRIFHTRFEDFAPDRRYDTIVAGDMIRYLADPAGFLRRAAGWLEASGRIVVTVPNGLSLHRRIGALMGMEDHPMSLNQQDRAVGNLMVYDRQALRALIREAGLDLLVLRGCLLKPVDGGRMADWPDALLDALLEVGDELEEHAWFLYAVACNPDVHAPATGQTALGSRQR